MALISAAALTLGTMVGLTAAPANAASTWRAPVASSDPKAWKPGQVKCADMLFIGARGSGETGQYGAEVNVIRQHMQQGMDANQSNATVRQVWVDYPAASVDVLWKDIYTGHLTRAMGSKYFTGALNGYQSAARVLSASLHLCPNEKWVSAAYSQGALITDELQINFDYPSRWAYSYSVGNTANFPNRNTQVGGTAFDNGHRPTGIYTAVYSTKAQLSANLESKTYTYCTMYDGMCDFSVLKFLAAYNSKPKFPIHGGYASGSQLWDSSFSAGVEIAHAVGHQGPTAPSDAVASIPDAGLKACILGEYKTEFGTTLTDITQKQLATIQRLDCAGYYTVDNLTGLQYATSLTYLSIGDDRTQDWTLLPSLSNVSAISQLSNLRTLFIERVSDLAPLSSLTGLTDLTVAESSFTTLNALSPLKALIHLSLMSGDGNSANNPGGFTDLTPILNFPNLTSLGIYTPRVCNFTPLAQYATRGVSMGLYDFGRLPAATAGVPYTLPSCLAPDGTPLTYSFINGDYTPADANGTISGTTATYAKALGDVVVGGHTQTTQIEMGVQLMQEVD